MFIEIKGIDLVPATSPRGVIWSKAPEFASGRMPTQLAGISVTVNKKPTYLYFYCSAVTDPACATDQINVLTTLDATVGEVQVVVTNSGAFASNGSCGNGRFTTTEDDRTCHSDLEFQNRPRGSGQCLRAETADGLWRSRQPRSRRIAS